MPRVDPREVAAALDEAREPVRLPLEEAMYIAEMIRICRAERDHEDDDLLRMRIKRAHHSERCTVATCYCYDPVFGDPMCECGQAGCFCRCEQIAEQYGLTDDDECFETYEGELCP